LLFLVQVPESIAYLMTMSILLI